MVERTVVWTETAAKQRREILKYWTNRNGSTLYAEKLIEITADRIQTILSHPESFKPTNFPETRVSAMGHFSIFYKLTLDHIIITAFWDNRQDPKILFETLTNTNKL
jgi:plasmid stabilization system protein ParE